MNDAQELSQDKTHSPEAPGVPASRNGLVKERADTIFETDVMSMKRYLSRYVKVSGLYGSFHTRYAMKEVIHARNGS